MPACWTLRARASPAARGTEASPYQIGSAEALAWFAYQVNGGQPALWGTVSADINLTGAAYGGTADAPLQWTPMTGYTATFDGGDKTISYMAVDSTSSGAGLFGSAVNATIKNVHIGGGQPCVRNKLVRRGWWATSRAAQWKIAPTPLRCARNLKWAVMAMITARAGSWVKTDGIVTISRCKNTGEVYAGYSGYNLRRRILGLQMAEQRPSGTVITGAHIDGGMTPLRRRRFSGRKQKRNNDY